MALEGISQRSIAATLTRAGILSPSGKAHWTATTISHILRNPIYSGTYVALRTKAEVPRIRRGQTYGKSSRVLREEGGHIPLPGLVTEAIVTEERFDELQQKLARNKAKGGRVTQFYLLRGMVRCELCGRAWRGKRQQTNGRTYYRYTCPGRERPNSGVRCHAGSYDGRRLEDRVWNRVVEFLTQPDVLLNCVRDRENARPDAVEKHEAAVGRLRRQLERVDSADAKAYSGYARGITDEEMYIRVRAELRAERRWIEEELEQTQAAQKTARSRVITADVVRKLLPQLKDRIEAATPEDKRFVLECLGAETTAGPSSVQLSLAVPESTLSAVSYRPGTVRWAQPPGGGAASVAPSMD
jgi:site-specific DNA recombinase